MSSMKAQPHALMFPYPSLSHINPMMQLAKRLLQHGFFITFVNTEFNHQHLFKPGSGHPQELHLRFEQIADGLPPSHMRVNEKSGVMEFMVAILALSGPFAKLVKRIMSRVDDAFPPLTCIIADSFSSWMQGVADQFRIPRVSLWTSPVHANLAYTFQSTLVSHGLIPVTDKSKLAEEVKCIEGIAPMKLEDYVSFFLVDTPTDFLYQWCLRLAMKRPEEALWNLGNNFEELESEAVNAFKKVVPNFLPVGPLLPAEMLSGHGALAPDAMTGHTGAMSLLPEDLSCSDWLSQHDTASVIYISFGSIVNMSEEELADFILGLEESGAPFLWAVRPEQGGVALMQLRKQLDAEATEGNRSRRGLIVSWAPQLAVLRHPSVGLFLTHCGWNSIVESLVAGVPILAKAGGFAEQRMNAYYVEEVWKVGLRLPRRAMAGVVKSQICALLGSSALASEVRECVEQARRSALAAVAPSSRGSSSCNLRLFIDDMHRRAAE